MRMVTSLGDLELTLCSGDVPTTVQNFLSYVQSGAYTQTGFVHRSVQGTSAPPFYIFQGGGYFVDSTPGGIEFVSSVSGNDPIPMEYLLPNDRATIAMANSGPDTATSQWFINVQDNTAVFNESNPYAVFGSLTDASLPVMDAIAALSSWDISSPIFRSTPLLTDYPGGDVSYFPYLVMVTDVIDLPEPDGSLQALAAAVSILFLARVRRSSLTRCQQSSDG